MAQQLLSNLASLLIQRNKINENFSDLYNTYGQKVDKVSGKQLTTEDYTSAEKVKLNNIQPGATVNDTDSNLKNRANHTGTQPASTIIEDASHRFVTDTEKANWSAGSGSGLALGETSVTAYRGDRGVIAYDFAVSHANVDNTSDLSKPVSTAVQAQLNLKQATLVSGTNIKTINGVSILGSGDLPISGGSGIALGETSSTAYRGDRGKAAYDHSLLTTNPHGVTKAQVGLSNVDNTSDTAKPLSAAMTSALASKADLVSGSIPLAQLPEAGLDEDQFQVKPGTTKLQVKPSLFGQDGLDLTTIPGYVSGVQKMLYTTTAGGFEWGPVPSGGTTIPLSKSTQTTSQTAATGFTNSWTAVSNAASYTWQIATSSDFTTGLQAVYTGTDLTKSVTGLTGSTLYYSRVITNPVAGYSASISDTVNVTTLASGGGASLTNVATPSAASLNKFTFDPSTATFTRSDAAAGNAPYSLLKERVAINSSTSAILQAKDPATNGGQLLVLHTSNAYTATPLIYFQRNPANPKVEAFINGDYITVEGYSTGDILLRFKIEGLQITPQYSANNGTTWIGNVSKTLTNGTTLWAQVTQGEDGTVMQNVQQSGFLIA
jgi:hypothetical protein